MDDLIVKLDRSIDEVLVNHGKVVLRLSSPPLSRSGHDREAHERSVYLFLVCANRSADPRVRKLAEKLQDAGRPRLRLVSSR